MKIKNRSGELVVRKKKITGAKFLYSFVLGRIILKVLTRPSFSRLGATVMSSPISKAWNKKFIKKNKINLDEYEPKKYRNYNELFTRTIRPESRPINYDDNIFISPCDSKLLVYPINDDSVFIIKDVEYSVSDLVNGKNLKKYKDGLALVFRLEVNDYHHYCYIDDGKKEDNIYIKGILHTVQPISNKYKVFKRNAREYTILHTKNFGDIVDIEVGALMVGKIVNHHGANYNFKKGEEKGYFEFGGSTIVLLVKKDVLKLDRDILENSLLGIETIVKYGERIGKKK